MIKKFVFCMFILLGLFQVSFATLEGVELPPKDEVSPNHPLGEIPKGGVIGSPNIQHPFSNDLSSGGDGTSGSGD